MRDRNQQKSNKNLDFLKIFIDLFHAICDSIISKPAKPLLSGMLKCGGFFFFAGGLR